MPELDPRLQRILERGGQLRRARRLQGAVGATAVVVLIVGALVVTLPRDSDDLEVTSEADSSTTTTTTTTAVREPSTTTSTTDDGTTATAPPPSSAGNETTTTSAPEPKDDLEVRVISPDVSEAGFQTPVRFRYNLPPRHHVCGERVRVDGGQWTPQRSDCSSMCNVAGEPANGGEQQRTRYLEIKKPGAHTVDVKVDIISESCSEPPVTLDGTGQVMTTAPGGDLPDPGAVVEGETGDFEELQAALHAARAKWSATKPAGYRIRSFRECFCGPFLPTAFTTVNPDGRVIDQHDSFGDALEPRAPSIEERFDDIQERIDQARERADQEHHRVRARFDQKYGFPVEYDFDLELWRGNPLSDDEVTQTIEWFNPG